MRKLSFQLLTILTVVLCPDNPLSTCNIGENFDTSAHSYFSTWYFLSWKFSVSLNSDLSDFMTIFTYQPDQ